MKKATVIAAGVLAFAAGAIVGSFFFGRLKPVLLPETRPQPLAELELPGAVEEPILPQPGPDEPGHFSGVIEPTPYFPPPSLNLTGARLGNQRVAAASDLGDIGRILYHPQTKSLFMAVVEKDTQLRAVWKLEENGRLSRVMAVNNQRGEMTIHGDSRGRMYVQHNLPYETYRSDDDGKTWKVIFENVAPFWQIADDGKGTLYGTLHDTNRAILYRSVDDGLSWYEWIDFQKLFPEYAVRYDQNDPRFKLRHLHGVVYLDGQLLVGTGDLARFTFASDDGGATWKKVWNEGFTADVPMIDGKRVLLCPDQFRRSGIGLYESSTKTTSNVWMPGPYGYSGYCYSMLSAFGVYYAAFHNEANDVSDLQSKFGVIASPDGETWYPFLEFGPLAQNARTDIFLALGPNIVYASMNGALYAFQPIDRTWFETHKPFEKVSE